MGIIRYKVKGIRIEVRFRVRLKVLGYEVVGVRIEMR